MPGIISWGCYIPKFRIKAEEIAQARGDNVKNIKESLKIEEKSLPNIDEDAATLAVEASRNAINAAKINPKEIGAIYIGSESHPYAVKPTGAIVAEAIAMSNNYTTADLQFACKAGTAGIQIALALIRAGMAKYALAGGSDTAQASPGDILEYTAAAGSAMFLLGKEKVVAEINETVSFTSDTPDFWRKKEQKYPKHAGSFSGEPGYFRHINQAAKLLMGKCKTTTKDYDYAVFHQPNGKFPNNIAKMLGFTKEQVHPGVIVDKIGNTYAASSLLGLCSVLDIAKPGQRIFLASYGSGAGSDCFDVTVTDEIINIQKMTKRVESYIKRKQYVDYLTYLKNTGAL